MKKLFQTFVAVIILLSMSASVGYAAERGNSTDNTAAICQAVSKYFKEENLKFSDFNDKNIAYISFNLDSELSSLGFVIRAENGMLMFRSVLPVKAEESSRAVVAEYLLRANYGMKNGCFDFDFNDGEISFRVFLYCADAVPTKKQVFYAMKLSIAMVKRYDDGLLKVMHGNENPAEVIRQIESD